MYGLTYTGFSSSCCIKSFLGHSATCDTFTPENSRKTESWFISGIVGYFSFKYCTILFCFSFVVYIFPIQDSNYHEEPVVGKWLSEIYNTVLDTSNLSIRSGLASPIQVKKMLNVSQISWDIVITSMLTTMGSCCVVGTNEDFINRVLICWCKDCDFYFILSEKYI